MRDKLFFLLSFFVAFVAYSNYQNGDMTGFFVYGIAFLLVMFVSLVRMIKGRK